MLKKILLLAVAGATVASWSAYAGIQNPGSLYTNGAKATTFDVHSDGAKSRFDVYSDGI